MITSNRKFGVEIEFFCPDDKDYVRARQTLNIKRDGSLTAMRNGGEYVTRVLQGAQGEHQIRNDCAVLNKYNCKSGHPQTSVHVHLDGMRGGKKIIRHAHIEPGKSMIAISNRVAKTISRETIDNIILGKYFAGNDEIKFTKIDNVKYIAFAKLTKHPKINYKYYSVEEVDRFNWLRNVFYFYTQYSDVIEAMVSNSRKMGNMYCIPLGSSYMLAEIAECKNIEDIRRVWYKGRHIDGHYDDSRYHNVNIHSYFSDTGTIEIRCHGGTTDPDKILLWVKLHQFILDKLENVELENIQTTATGNELYKEFIKFIAEDELLVEYTKRLLGYFSGIKI